MASERSAQTSFRVGPSTLPAVTHVARQTTTVISFTTTVAAAESMLPPHFAPTAEPVVTFTHQMLEGVDYMRGRGYNLLNVAVSAVFTGRGGSIERSCPVVIWENNTMPIIAGREIHGNPKIYGAVSDIVIDEDSRSFECCEYDTVLIRGTVRSLRPVTEDRLARVNAGAADTSMFGWKFVPGREEADLDYPTMIHASAFFDKAWSGTGGLDLHAPTVDQAPFSAAALERLRALPQLNQRPAFSGVGVATLFRDRTEALT
jgi:hypothetical protein